MELVLEVEFAMISDQGATLLTSPTLVDQRDASSSKEDEIEVPLLLFWRLPRLSRRKTLLPLLMVRARRIWLKVAMCYWRLIQSPRRVMPLLPRLQVESLQRFPKSP